MLPPALALQPLMMIQVILLVGVVVLICGSLGLFVVRAHSRRLNGLGWLALAFLLGGIGAALLAFDNLGPAFILVSIADVLVLSAFILLHVSVSRLITGERRFPLLGATLLLIQLVTDLYVVMAHGPNRFRLAVVGLMVAAQAGETALVMLRTPVKALRVPARFGGVILLGFLLANAARSLAAATGFLSSHHQLATEVALATYTMFIAVALGIAFTVFWMTNAMLTAELDQMASVDPLTRLYNRRVFLLWCEQEIERSRRTNAAFSLLMLDLDYFKLINDSFGHPAGDNAICLAVEKMQHAVRGIDVLGRWGGEEFTVLLPSADLDAAYLVAERVRNNIGGIVIGAPEGQWDREAKGLRLTVSVGIATYRGSNDTIEKMLHRADQSLYEAKAAGRNKVIASA